VTASRHHERQATATDRGRVVTSPLLTAREVADVVGVSSETVLRWARRGELPAIRLPGGAIRVRENVLDEWLRERSTVSER
jgi:excisionase family DNA binding protein